MSSQVEEDASFWASYLPTATKGVALFLLVCPFVAYVSISALDLRDLLTHLIVISPFLAAIIYSGYWLVQGGVPPRRWSRIGNWFLGGLLAFLSLNVIMMLLLGNSIPYYFHPFWGFFASDVGSAVGLTIGIFEAQTLEQERLAERRRMQQEAARRRRKQFENFAQIVSHDLRNPLNVAQGRLQLAREEQDSAHLVAVADAMERMDEIIEDVLMLTWSGQGIDSHEVQALCLQDVATASWEHVDTEGARLQVEDAPQVRADGTRLQRLLENLFRNAVEHGGQAVTVRIGGLPGGFYVEDNGPGIPRENREKIFEAGYSSGEEGTGLGLSIVQAIAEAHGWDVSATEGRDGGVRFEFLAANGEVA